MAVPLGLLGGVPFVGDLLESRGAVSAIAAIVLAAMLWITLFALTRFQRAAAENATVTTAAELFRPDPKERGPEAARLLATHRDPVTAARFAGGLVGGRIAAVLHDADWDRDTASAVLAARADIDHARSDVAYGPARAVVWAMPALGFLGTAAEMAKAVDGLGESVRGAQGYAALRDALVRDVVPPLADAFGVTLFALAASVICHLLLTWTGSREQSVLLAVEETTLTAIAAAGLTRSTEGAGLDGEAARALGHQITQLTEREGQVSGGLDRLVSHLETASRAVSDAGGRLPALDLQQVQALLQSVDGRLEAIRDGLGQDLIVTRGLAGPPASGGRADPAGGPAGPSLPPGLGGPNGLFGPTDPTGPTGPGGTGGTGGTRGRPGAPGGRDTPRASAPPASGGRAGPVHPSGRLGPVFPGSALGSDPGAADDDRPGEGGGPGRRT
ncbi:hypothetical protein GEV43_01075 [Actinomadura sp. J1-007]|uniref:hypothetical protein n=1 Tax=Actinomadura sp. J1-007 TaxID=2661913 RepID=UPI001322AF96|nr:hypothetical protein [Actinomadura sp. J1-007]MWK32793.1 hypothetical protein [Actinomadura sp. J1-007]